jgi:hypothetical protein
LTQHRTTTVAELEDWERNGAVWRPVELDERHVVVDLRSCSGELMERVQGEDPGLIDFVRAHPRD